MNRIPAPTNRDLAEWLAWQSSLHASEMELGLERVGRVAERLGCLPPSRQTVVVGGTNGKGSCARLLESLLGDHARVGTYTSPHLWHYNERVRIDGAPASDADLCLAFAAVDAARRDVALTYFEFGTLAALWLFQRYGVDYTVLEVGLGGRLDAVNIVDADVALITNIGLDHMDWLGPDRHHIGHEKAGIMRAGRPVVCADRDMPDSVSDHAERLGARLLKIGESFDLARCDNGRWRWMDAHARDVVLAPQTGVLADNLAAVLAVYSCLFDRLPEADAVERACSAQRLLPGRREYVDGPYVVIYDVGHNLEAVAVLVDELIDRPVEGETAVVLGMLADKPANAVAARLGRIADRFYLAGLDGLSPRGLSASALAERTALVGECFDTPMAALAAARAQASPGDRIVVCGSFLTVAHACPERAMAPPPVAEQVPVVHTETS
ncbi:bifunctional tetrahydrofolate synthase/dihydrofolate synthase [Salinisphaera sp. T31B1]|uniref:bifunctional tetrahydrofolate synthase/dihydrofolate synthase n=1 Tax=Salinisphaera sp. T31B1 TaxID=727963 RepID=UPI00334097C8